MDIQEYIEKLRNIQQSILTFIENEDNNEENYENFNNNLEEQNIKNDQEDLKIFLHMIAKISNNHHRSINFFMKIEKILDTLKTDIQSNFTNSEIFEIFRGNKRILLFLIEEKIVNIDKDIFQELMNSKYQSSFYFEYFLPEIKTFIEESQEDKETEGANYLNYDEIPKFDSEIFNEKRKNGENDGYLYTIIQKDSLDEYVTFVSQNDLPSQSFVELSIFETNPFLLKREKTTLIEYSAFCGSKQIFKYLCDSGAELTPSLLLYSIHSNDVEIIDFLIENHIEPKLDQVTYELCLKESIKCHHNEITNYILNKFEDKQKSKETIVPFCFQYYNFSFFPDVIRINSTFHFACKYDYLTIVLLLFENDKIDINAKLMNVHIMNILMKRLCGLLQKKAMKKF
ncbi:hypothetical protein M9Y10_018640 [Tritrichomonas musculus]|uniref:DUF3447 domain-containing protein n=1 Tax=Tritrichomonas musculus TaxID=1915356 RepID=A0ABR2HP19_9EUKA